jgi:hypothetical protein
MIDNVSSILMMFKERRKILGSVCTLIGFILWLIVISTFRVWWVPPTKSFGLYQVVPVWFWIGIVLIITGMLFTLDISSRLHFCLQFVLLNLVVWGTPVFIEPNARITDTWIHYSRTHIILDTGHIPASSSAGYFDWPGSFIFHAMNLQVIGVDFTAYLKFFPLISSTIFIFGYYLLVRKIVKDKIVGRFAILLEIPLNVWLQFHFSPQSFALMLFPLIMLGFLKTGRKWWIAIGILGTALILSHPTTSIFLASILFFTFLTGIIVSRSLKTSKKRLLPQGFILLIILAGTILMFFLSGSLIQIISLIAKNLGKLPETFLGIFENRASKIPSSLRLIIIAIFGILSLISVFYLRKDKNMLKLSSGWIAGVGAVFLVDVTLPGAHFHNRALFYFYLIFPMLVCILLFQKPSIKKLKKPLLIVLIILSLLNLLTIFYIENEAIISDSNLDAVDFVHTYTTDRLINVEQAAVIRAYDPESDTKSIVRREDIPQGSIVIFDDYALVSDIVGDRTNWRYDYITSANYTDKVYSSGTFEVFFYNITD